MSHLRGIFEQRHRKGQLAQTRSQEVGSSDRKVPSVGSDSVWKADIPEVPCVVLIGFCKTINVHQKGEGGTEATKRREDSAHLSQLSKEWEGERCVVQATKANMDRIRPRTHNSSCSVCRRGQACSINTRGASPQLLGTLLVTPKSDALKRLSCDAQVFPLRWNEIVNTLNWATFS